MEHYSSFLIIPDAPRIHFSLLFLTLFTFFTFYDPTFYVYAPWEMMKIVFAFYSRFSHLAGVRGATWTLTLIECDWSDNHLMFPVLEMLYRNFHLPCLSRNVTQRRRLSGVVPELGLPLLPPKAINHGDVTAFSPARLRSRCKTSEKSRKKAASAVKDKKGSTFELILRSTLDFSFLVLRTREFQLMTMAEIISYKFFISSCYLVPFHPFKSEDIPNEGKMAVE